MPDIPPTVASGAPQIFSVQASTSSPHKLPGETWGVALRLEFAVWGQARKAAKREANELWLKQVLDLSGLVWERSNGERKPFSKHVEEYFLLSTAPEDKWARTSLDTHSAFYYDDKRKGGGSYGLMGLPCGFSIVVVGTLTVGKLYKSLGSKWSSPWRAFYLDQESTSASGPTAPVGTGTRAASIRKPQTRAGAEPINEVPRPGGGPDFLWQSLEGQLPDGFPSSTYYYRLYKDTCPTVTITPPDCFDRMTTSAPKGTTSFGRGPDGPNSPWRDPKDLRDKSTPGIGPKPADPGDCVMPGPG